MNKHLQYARYIARHKYYVFVECMKLAPPCQNLPMLYRALKHDWVKFLPCEWFPYVEKFYGGEHPSWSSLHGDVRNLYPHKWTQEGVDEAFDEAWIHHQRSTDHHWQSKILHNDDGDTKILPMSDIQRREMLADWRGAGRAVGHPDTAAWYRKNRENIRLHPDTRAWIEQELDVSEG